MPKLLASNVFASSLVFNTGGFRRKFPSGGSAKGIPESSISLPSRLRERAGLRTSKKVQLQSGNIPPDKGSFPKFELGCGIHNDYSRKNVRDNTKQHHYWRNDGDSMRTSLFRQDVGLNGGTPCCVGCPRLPRVSSVKLSIHLPMPGKNGT